MPDESGRIRRTAVNSMGTVMLSLNSFHREIVDFEHPRINVIFNDVSKQPKQKQTEIKYGESDSEEKPAGDEHDEELLSDSLESKHFIEVYKQQLIKIAH